MTNILTVRSPRWLGWLLLIAGVLDTVLWSFVIVMFAFVADEPWGDVAGTLFGLWVLGMLATAAGVRILRGTSRKRLAQ